MKDQQTPSFGSPFMTWDQVPKEAQAAVVQLAEQGQFHPDIRLARLAYAWAVPVARQRTWAMCLSGALTAVGGGNADMRRELRERRLARAITAPGDPDEANRV